MHLLSLRVLNYRAHKNTSIEFDRHLTLIGGPNESGKSTLVEAAHRALFLKSRTSGEYQKSMLSLHTADAPEVELQFAKDAQTYTVLKKFAGTRGTTLLTSSTGLNLRNDEAEEKLAQLVGLQAARYTPENWSHLWVWQGTSTNNLLNTDASYRTDLLQKLQRLGAAGLIQSDFDQRLKTRVLEAFESIFNKNGTFKASSDVFKAEKNRDSCHEQRNAKLQRFQELKLAADQYDTADRQLREITNQIAKQQQALDKARSELNQANVTKQQLADNERLLKDYQQQLNSLETAQRNFDLLHKQIKAAERKLTELKDAQENAIQSQKILQQNLATTTNQEANLNGLLRATRLRNNIAQALLQIESQSKDLLRLEKLREEITNCENERSNLQRRLASIPNISEKQLQELSQLDKDIFEVETSLKAMAASIKVLQSQEPVTLNGTPTATDTEYSIATTTELAIGNTTRLLISPGNGTSLADAQHNLSQLQQRLLKKLDQLRVPSYKEAQAFRNECVSLKQNIAILDAKLKDLDATQILKQLIDIQGCLERLNLDKQRDSDTLATLLKSEDVQLIELQSHETWQARYEALENQQQEIAVSLKQQRTEVEIGRDSIHHLEIEIKECERDIKNTQEKMEQESRKMGNPDERGAVVAQLKESIAARLTEIQQLQKTLTELSAEQLERLIIRHERSLPQLHQDRDNAIATRAGAHAKLRSDGSTDTYTELAAAESAYEYAQNQFELHQREALGTKLLKELFDNEQQNLSDALTEPFVQRMRKYVQCFTGEVAKITFEVTNKGFDQLRIARPSDNNTSVDFEHLSGGAKEQIAAAARLAIAEVLASDSPDGLPIVFDDAFSYTDSQRLEALPRMIERAIDAGLQIIIVTCNPLQYARLGATTIQLTR
jgi:DNA repair exonuclease SbcCD ATPase subunit